MQQQTFALLLSASFFFSLHLIVRAFVCVCVPTPTFGAASFSKPLRRPDSQLGEHQGRQCTELTHPFLLTRENRGLACVSTCVHVSFHMCKGRHLFGSTFCFSVILWSKMQNHDVLLKFLSHPPEFCTVFTLVVLKNY